MGPSVSTQVQVMQNKLHLLSVLLCPQKSLGYTKAPFAIYFNFFFWSFTSFLSLSFAN